MSEICESCSRKKEEETLSLCKHCGSLVCRTCQLNDSICYLCYEKCETCNETTNFLYFCEACGKTFCDFCYVVADMCQDCVNDRVMEQWNI